MLGSNNGHRRNSSQERERALLEGCGGFATSGVPGACSGKVFAVPVYESILSNKIHCGKDGREDWIVTCQHHAVTLRPDSICVIG